MRVFRQGALLGAAFICILAAAADGQMLGLAGGPLHVGEPFTFSLSGGNPGALYMLALDVNGGPTEVSGFGTVELGLGATTFFAPSGLLDASGTGTLASVLPAAAGLIGHHYHAQAVAFDPAASYGWRLSAPWSGGVHPTAGALSTTAVLPAGENTTHLVDFAPGSFPLYGTSYTEFYVTSNGLLTFGGADNDATESIVELIMGPAKVAALWDDFSPQLQGEVRVETGSDFVRVVWSDLRQYSAADHNTAEVTLFQDGAISLQWPHVETADGLVGIAPGNWQGVPVYPSFAQATLGSSGGANPVCQQFWPSSSPFDLEGTTLSFVPDAAGGYTWVR